MSDNKPAYRDRWYRGDIYTVPLDYNDPDTGVILQFPADENEPMSFEMELSRKQWQELAAAVTQGAVILFPDEAGRVIYNFERAVNAPQEALMQMRPASTGCGWDISNDRGETWETIDLSCLVSGEQNTAVSKDILNQFQSILNEYLQNNRDQTTITDGSTFDTELQTVRDAAMCMASVALVNGICEVELQRREDAEQDLLDLIGTVVAGVIVAMIPIASAPIVYALIAAIATRVMAGVFAQLHIIDAGDLRSQAARRATACCLFNAVQGQSGNLWTYVQQAAACTDDYSLPGVVEMFADDSIFAGWLQAVVEYIPVAKTGVWVCPCSYIPADGELLLSDEFSGIVALPATIEVGTIISPSGPLNGDGLLTVTAVNTDCTDSFTYYKEAVFTSKIALVYDAVALYAQVVGLQTFGGQSSAGAEMGYDVELWNETDTALIASQSKTGVWQVDNPAYHYIGMKIGSVPAGNYVLRVRQRVCTDDGGTTGELYRVRLWSDYDFAEYDTEVAV